MNMDNIAKVLDDYAGIIIANQGLMLQLLSPLQQDRETAESIYKYGKIMIEYGTKVSNNAKEENDAEKNND